MPRTNFALLAFIALSLALRAGAQPSGMRTYCNPLDVNYQYNFEQFNERISYRSGADPVIINHKDEYYLFSTIAQGWWHSKDLSRWRHVRPDKWSVRGVVAPAALSVRDTLYLLPSTYDRLPIFYTTTPETGHLDYFNRLLPFLPRGPWDPAFFHDPDTDEWYLYWGSSNLYPLYGIRLDHDRQLVYEGTPTELFVLHPDEHGWERFGQDHRGTIDPFMEGAWMTKHGGKYYASDSTVYTQFRLHGSVDGEHWVPLADLTGEKRDRPNAYIELSEPVKARYIRYEHVYVASAHLAISDIRVFGNGSNPPPPTPATFAVQRDADLCNAFITWEAVPGAVGYNILWGVAEDKLYQTYQVFADAENRLELRALNMGQDYYFAIEAFDENGVSERSSQNSSPLASGGAQ